MRGAAASFPRNQRFAYQHVVGVGGMGVVFAAHDHERGLEVALKTLPAGDARALVRLKREFRTLAALEHPNLVRLYELEVEGGQAFFTMEYVEGAGFLEWVRPAEVAHARPPATRALGDTGADAPAEAAHTTGGVDLGRLLGALEQLTDALEYLHAAGVVHRDIKPSNILIRPDGRLVLLDFGIADESHRAPGSETMGTPAYMSPEQARGQRVTGASDWFSTGVMLAEALAGRRPELDVTRELTGPAAGGRAVPAADDPPQRLLGELAEALMVPEPTLRPDAAEVRRRLGEVAAALGARALTARPPRIPFVGRARELAVLEEALALAETGSGWVLVSGPSGVGKTRLVREFLNRAAARCRILGGRCYAEERLAFNALDSVVDELGELGAAHLARLGRDDLAALLELFPALSAAVAGPGLRAKGEPFELRARAFAALAKLFAAVAAERPLVVAIDDLHWADADSVALLGALADAGPSHVVWVVTFWDDAVPPATPLGTLLARLEPARRIALGGLTEPETADLLRATGGASDRAGVVHAETAGNPFFVTELLRAPGAEPHELGGLLAGRIDALAPGMRGLIEHLAVAGEPMGARVVARAAGLTAPERQHALEVLLGARLVRLAGRRADLAIYHDRIRAAVLAELAPAGLKARHGALARALEGEPGASAEARFRHWRDAGEPARAAPHALTAAAEAAAKLAFERAAELCSAALELGLSPGERRRALRMRGEALAGAGLSVPAAESLLAAREGAAEEERSELLRTAVGQLMQSGHLAQGIALAKRALPEHGLSWPGSRAQAVAGVLRRRAQLRLRGLGFTPRPGPSTAAAAIDLCWLIGSGLALIDPVRGLYFHLTSLCLALEAGDPARAGRALAGEATFIAALRPTRVPEARRVLDQAQRLSALAGDSALSALIPVADGLLCHREGRFLEAADRLERAERTLREEHRDVHWEVTIAQRGALLALEYAGQMTRARALLARFEASARRRGDQFALANFIAHRARHALCDDDPAYANQLMTGLLDGWRGADTDLPKLQELVSRTMIVTYQGPQGDLAVLAQLLREIDVGRILRSSFMGSAYSELLQAYLGAARVFHLRGGKLGALETLRVRLICRHAVSHMARAAQPWVRAWAAIHRGVVAAQQGRPEAVPELEQAARLVDSAEMTGFAACVRHELGRLRGDAEAQAAAAAVLLACGYRNPARAAATLVSGLP